eukprot:115559-Amphidinium_carterae.1
MDAETGAKFQTKDLAWQAYYEKMRQAAGYSDGPATMRPQLSQPKASAPCAVAPPEVKGEHFNMALRDAHTNNVR